MSYNISKTYRTGSLIAFFTALSIYTSYGQETSPNVGTNTTYHNQLFFNRFLINPTFSLVRENKSYLNILHRNQYATFDDNSQNYFVGFSNKLNENTAVGIGVYSQWSGVIQEFGFNANYATAVKLGEKSKLTFGTNLTYFNEGLDKNRVVATENDQEILDARKESKIAIQPGVTLSIGRFDFGLYAEDLFKYNQTTNEFLTSFNDRSVKASLQYTHSFNANRGLFENARLMPLVQMGRNEDNSLSYLGSILLDLPNYGWLQSTFDDEYGMSMGVGFNVSKKMSLGYLMEKDLSQKETNLGWNHEISLAYTFKDENDTASNYTDSSDDAKVDRIIRNYEEQILKLTTEQAEMAANSETVKAKKEEIKDYNINEIKSEINSLAYENRMILDELILRQDSIENARNAAFEKRFETIVRVLRNDIKMNLQETENTGNTALAENTKPMLIKKAAVQKDKYNDVRQFIGSDLESSKKTSVSSTETKEKIAPTTANIAEVKKEQRKNYEKLPIKLLGNSNMIGVKSGYYVIVNVYKTKKYLNAFMDDLKRQGHNAKKFYNKENGLYYVYLADFNYKQEAESAFVTDLGGKYRKEKWIMQVDNATATALNMYEDEETYTYQND